MQVLAEGHLLLLLALRSAKPNLKRGRSGDRQRLKRPSSSVRMLSKVAMVPNKIARLCVSLVEASAVVVSPGSCVMDGLHVVDK